MGHRKRTPPVTQPGTKGIKSAINKKPGTLSKTSASSGEVFESVKDRKSAGRTRQETGVEPQRKFNPVNPANVANVPGDPNTQVQTAEGGLTTNIAQEQTVQTPQELVTEKTAEQQNEQGFIENLQRRFDLLRSISLSSGEKTAFSVGIPSELTGQNLINIGFENNPFGLGTLGAGGLLSKAEKWFSKVFRSKGAVTNTYSRVKSFVFGRMAKQSGEATEDIARIVNKVEARKVEEVSSLSRAAKENLNRLVAAGRRGETVKNPTFKELGDRLEASGLSGAARKNLDRLASFNQRIGKKGQAGLTQTDKLTGSFFDEAAEGSTFITKDPRQRASYTAIQKMKPSKVSKALKWAVGVGGVGVLLAAGRQEAVYNYHVLDNVLGGNNIYARDMVNNVKFGQMTADQGLKHLEEQEAHNDIAYNKIIASAHLNPFNYPNAKYLADAADSAREIFQSYKDQLLTMKGVEDAANAAPGVIERSLGIGGENNDALTGARELAGFWANSREADQADDIAHQEEVSSMIQESQRLAREAELLGRSKDAEYYASVRQQILEFDAQRNRNKMANLLEYQKANNTYWKEVQKEREKQAKSKLLFGLLS